MNTTHTNEPTGLGGKIRENQLLETISLRDYFAAKAMQAAIANTDFEHKDMFAIGKLSYMQADAMLKAREVKS